MKKKVQQMKKYHKLKKSLKFSEQDFSDDDVKVLEEKVIEKDNEITSLRNDKLKLEEKLEEAEGSVKHTKTDGKTYSSEMRLMVFDALICQTPTEHIPTLIEKFSKKKKFSKRTGVNLDDVPSRTTVEAMTRELGCISDLETAEALMQNEDLTMGFDAKTQEGIHVNSVHFTTPACYEAALDELSGTASDYAHICDTAYKL